MAMFNIPKFETFLRKFCQTDKVYNTLILFLGKMRLYTHIQKQLKIIQIKNPLYLRTQLNSKFLFVDPLSLLFYLI